jgi:hypothetical protein
MGVRPVVYWTANLVLDSCIYTIPVTLFFILFAAFKYTTIIGPNFVAAALTFVGAIFATLSFNYLLSFAIDKYITAMQVGLAANALLGLIFAAGTIALQLLLSSGDSDKDYGWLGLVLPPMIPTASVYYVLYILAQLDFQRSINNTTGSTYLCHIFLKFSFKIYIFVVCWIRHVGCIAMEQSRWHYSDDLGVWRRVLVVGDLA